MSSIKIETGIKTYEIENENGKIIGTISFNPKDANLLFKLVNMENEINSIVEDAKTYEIKNPEAPEMEIAEKMTKYDEKIKAYIDDTFGEGTSQAVFGSQNVFNELNGNPFIVRFINAILPVIKMDIEGEAKKSRNKIKKYTKEVVD